jgi:putative phosphoribosyl transferase
VRFTDRQDAGRALADALANHPAIRHRDPLVLGLPRGGIPVAAEVAARLGAALDVLVVRKLGAPGHAELGIGAVGEGGVRVVDRRTVQALGVSPRYVDAVTEREQAELERRVEHYREGRAMQSVDGRTVVLVDDGIATGGTVRAAIEVLRAHGVGSIVVAVPVASPDTVVELSARVDAVVALRTPRRLGSVGEHYVDFSPTSDRDVVAILHAFHAEA